MRATRGCSGASVAHEPASIVTSTVFVDAEPSLQSPPRSHRRASSTPRLRGHAPTLRRWNWRVESGALTLVITSAIIDGVAPSVNGYRRALLCAFGRSTRPSDDISRSLIAPRRCSACRRWIAVLNRRLGVVIPVLQQLRRATTSDDTRHSSGMAEYATLVPATCSQGRRHGFESGGDKFCERSEQKFFFLAPPLFGQWGGQNIAYIDKSA